MPDFVFTGPGGRTITVTGPEGATRDQAVGILRQQHPELWQQPAAGAYAEEREPPNMDWIDVKGVGRAAKGAAKTVTGLGVGAGQILSDFDATGTLGRVGATRPAQAIKQWAMSPASSIAEEEGQILPYLSPTGLERLAATAATRGMLGGSVLGGLTPTESGSLQSHLIDAAAGGTVGGLAGAAGGTVPKLPHWFHMWHLLPVAGSLAWLAAAAGRRGLNAGPIAAVRRALAREAPAESTEAVRKATEESDEDAR